MKKHIYSHESSSSRPVTVGRLRTYPAAPLPLWHLAAAVPCLRLLVVPVSLISPSATGCRPGARPQNLGPRPISPCPPPFPPAPFIISWYSCVCSLLFKGLNYFHLHKLVKTNLLPYYPLNWFRSDLFSPPTFPLSPQPTETPTRPAIQLN